MEWNKVKKLAAIGLTGTMLLGTIMTVSAEDIDPGKTDAEATFKAGKIVDPDPGPGGPDDPDPVDPLEPPIGNDFLKVVHLPNLDFGTIEIQAGKTVHYAKGQEMDDGSAGLNYAKLIDQRGSNAGWNLTVKMDGQFRTTEDVTVKELTGTTLEFTNGILESQTGNEGDIGTLVNGYKESAVVNDSTATRIMDAKVNSGGGSWILWFGAGPLETVNDSEGNKIQENGEDVLYNKDIKLCIPETVTPDEASYKTQLVWTLQDTPVS